MGESVITCGNDYGLRFELEWTGLGVKSQSPAEATRGRMLLKIGGRCLWVGDGGPVSGLEWTWIDFLEFLDEVWPYLMWEEGYPFGLKPIDPSGLRNAAELRWQELPEAIVEDEEEEIYGFEETHDLARSLKGAVAPSVWLVREGRLIWIASQERSILRPLDETMETLSCVGDAIKNRLYDLSDERSLAAIEAWRKRRHHSIQRLASIATRLPVEVLHGLDRNRGLEEIFELPSEGFEITELLAAARMTQGQISDSSLKALLDSIRWIPSLQSTKLDRLSREAERLLEEAKKDKPYDQGYCLADWFGPFLESIGYKHQLGPKWILDQIGIPVHTVELPEPSVDAVACWGPRHGPAIIVNTRGLRSREEKGLRSSLAHEICHLLIDRIGALPLVEVLNGSAPPHVESRARAFAAELLLPRNLAYEEVVKTSDPAGAIDALRTEYGVSKEIVAWQVRNAGRPLPRNIFDLLRTFVSDPTRF